MPFLSTYWQKLVAPYRPSLTWVHDTWRELDRLYQQRSRHYHNWDHIQQMLRQADAFTYALADRELVQFAIFYHDAIYLTRPGNQSERRSARLAQQHMRELAISEERIDRCYRWITATKNHLAADVSEDRDLAYLLDFDRAILGAKPEVYERYAAKIRREYRWVPGPLYRRTRGRLLRQWLAAPYLYHTSSYRDRYEQQARDNIEAELALLVGSETPATSE